ncbi:hypothetical protein [Rossellomorea aquimaris]|uniref:hypothetical protein n=1 Tax=Rossellomorea aquimaris TaxID=189382 RepID=UPI0005CA3B8E|nr:hypothetical protein [Rossellomorea aquimaris]
MNVKKRILYLFILLALTILTACRLDFSEDKSSVQQMVKNDGSVGKAEKKGTENKSASDEKEEPAYTFNATVTLDSTSMLVEGDSTLPPDVTLYVRLRAYPEDASVTDIKDYQAEPYTKVISEDYMSIREDGTFKSSGLERPDYPQSYLLELIFAPTRFEESMQQKLVTESESVEDLPGMIPIDMPTQNEFLDDVVPRYIKHVNIMLSDEGDGDDVTLELVPVES